LRRHDQPHVLGIDNGRDHMARMYSREPFEWPGLAPGISRASRRREDRPRGVQRRVRREDDHSGVACERAELRVAPEQASCADRHVINVGSFRSIGYNFTRAASLVAERAIDRSGSANGHLTSPRNGHLTFRKTAVGGPPLKHGTLGSGQAARSPKSGALVLSVKGSFVRLTLPDLCV
jgi:hypothetical protein